MTVSSVVRRAAVLLVLALAGVLTGRLITTWWSHEHPETAAPTAGPVTAPASGAGSSASADGSADGSADAGAGPAALTPDPPEGRGRCATALAVVHAWDARRAAAYAQGDLRALARLYVPGSAVAAADRRTLQAYADRGLVVRGMRMQVLACRAPHLSAGRLEMHLTDRLFGATAVGQGVRRALPRDAPSTRRLVLVRRAGTWRLRSAVDT